MKSDNHFIKREAGDNEDNVPDRMVNPEGYRQFSEVNKETHQTTNNQHMASHNDQKQCDLTTS